MANPPPTNPPPRLSTDQSAVPRSHTPPRLNAPPILRPPPVDDIFRANPSPQTVHSIERLGSAISRLSRNSSGLSNGHEPTHHPSTRHAEGNTRPEPSVPLNSKPTTILSEGRETLTMKQVANSIIGLKEAAQCFRVKDEHRRRKYRVLFPGDTKSPTAPEFLVVDEHGKPIWSVRPSRSAAAKVLLKPGSDYRIVLRRRHWVPYVNRLVEGVALRAGQERLVFVVRGDPLGKRFSIYADKELIAQAHRATQMAQLGRNVWPTMADMSGCLWIAVWTLRVEPGVDTALMTAVMSVLEKWTAEEKQGTR